MRTRESEEMYLETILLLQKRNLFVRSIDVAEELNYSRASVSRAVKLLQMKNYITVGKNGEILLTEEGNAKASDVYERHRSITKFLQITGADPALAEENACRIEHVISAEMFQKIKQFCEKE